jgi:hypothetical protein
MNGGLFSCIEKSGFRNFLEDGLSDSIKISNLIFLLEIENTLSLIIFWLLYEFSSNFSRNLKNMSFYLCEIYFTCLVYYSRKLDISQTGSEFFRNIEKFYKKCGKKIWDRNYQHSRTKTRWWISDDKLDLFFNYHN